MKLSLARFSAPVLVAALAFSLAGCGDNDVDAELRSLSASEDAAFVCRDGTGAGLPFSECPDRDTSDDETLEGRHSIYSLVTQTVTDEVAVVNVTAGKVVDVDKATPGFGFLRVGARPISIATSPGGAATFVTVSDPGYHGIFALPTTCLDAPSPGQKTRDLTSWPACSLGSAPGEIAVLVEPATADGTVAGSCGGSAEVKPDADALQGLDCPADFTREGGPVGRRKLVVSLPDLGQLAIIDAQTLVDRHQQEPGSFPPCEIERLVPLGVDLPSRAEQTLPPDLEPVEGAGTCGSQAPLPPPDVPGAPRPAGFAVSDRQLFVADTAAPVVHVLDTTSVCDMNEAPPLLPRSLREPTRLVTTRRVAVSPLTRGGKRWLYAVDGEDRPGASVMVFDVSPDATERTPLVRPGAPEQPFEPADRLQFSSSVRDVSFAYRDLPYLNATTGVGVFGTLCDPNPSAPLDSLGAAARPEGSDYAVGARPGLLRGLFGFALLTSGQVAVVDVEDFDAPCRRPIGANSSSTPDFRGCKDDRPRGVDFYTSDGTATGERLVTNEVSCQVVQPHRVRSTSVAVTSPEIGARSPSLRGFPQLSLPSSARSTLPDDRPRLLAVPFNGTRAGTSVPAEVYVGTTLYSAADGASSHLPSDPNAADSESESLQHSLALPPREPRAYPADDSSSLTYEGSYAGDRFTGLVQADGANLIFADDSQSFCGTGVYDAPMIADYAEQELGLAPENAAAFGLSHADYVQIISNFPDEDASYWRSGAPVTRAECLTRFGEVDADTKELRPERDLVIERAFADRLQVRSRALDPAATEDAADFARLLEGCFPATVNYRLRVGAHWVLTHTATGYQHDVTTAADNSCIRDCDPLRKWSKSRIFEVSAPIDDCVDLAPASDDDDDEPADPKQNRVGCERVPTTQTPLAASAPQPFDFGACVRAQGPVAADDRCVYDGLTARFALYRGRMPSARDMVFTWQTAGGFRPLLMSLLTISSSVSPQSLTYLPQTEFVAVVDGSTLGLSLFDIDDFSVIDPSPFF